MPKPRKPLFGPTVDVPVGQCPICQAPYEAATNLGATSPRPVKGDLAVCLQCASVNQYTADLTLEVYPPEDFSLLPIAMRKRIWALQDAITTFNALDKKGEPIP